MKITINFNNFNDELANLSDQFSYEGTEALYNYLTELEEETGEEIEFDPIALLDDYTEYKNLKAVRSDYPHIKNMDDLKDHTTVIKFDSGLIVANF
jgi:hypothetical protein